MSRATIIAAYLLLLLLQVPITGGLLGGGVVSLVIFAFVDIIFFVFAIVFSRRIYDRNFFLNPIVGSMLMFFLWAVFSFFWTVQDNLIYSFALLVRDLMRMLTIYLLVLNSGRRAVSIALSYATQFAIIIYPLLFMLTASYSFDFISGEGRLMYAGVKDANASSRDLGLLMLLVIWVYFNKLYFNKILILVGFLLLITAYILSFSKTVFVALAIAGYYIFTPKKLFSLSRVAHLFIFLMVIIAILYYRFDYFNQYINEVQGGHALETLSGRTIIWDIFFKNISDNLIIGHGINSFSVYTMELPNNPGTVHNEIMNIVFNYGGIGLILFGRIIFHYFKKMRGTEGSSMTRLPIAVMLFFIVIGLTESNLVSFLFPAYFMIIVLATNLAKKEHN